VVVGCTRRIAAAAVILGSVRERALEDGAVPHEQTADVERLEEPLVRIDRERVRALEGRHERGESRGQPRRAAVRRVDVEPDAFGLGEVGEVAERVDRSRVRRAGGADDGEGRPARRAVGRDGHRDGLGLEAEAFVGRDPHERVGREARDREGPRGREVRLV
jgi:hypothetical protein